MFPPMDFLRDLSIIGENSLDNPSKIRDYVTQLEDELRKIDAFKRELPLCMLLVTHAIVRLKEETLKGNYDEDERAKLGKDDKKSWMSSAQLWNSNTDPHIETQHDSVVELNNKGSEEDNNGISLGLPIAAKSDSRNVSSEINVVAGDGLSMPFIQTKPNQHQQQQKHIFSRKQRRSWSTELHRRFMNALQQLGGAQVATPKQIRELMHVDGLTNDEVKSHLQKYRLHIRKLPFLDATPNEL